jgi:hypothetical protein
VAEIILRTNIRIHSELSLLRVHVNGSLILSSGAHTSRMAPSSNSFESPGSPPQNRLFIGHRLTA